MAADSSGTPGVTFFKKQLPFWFKRFASLCRSGRKLRILLSPVFGIVLRRGLLTSCGLTFPCVIAVGEQRTEASSRPNPQQTALMRHSGNPLRLRTPPLFHAVTSQRLHLRIMQRYVFGSHNRIVCKHGVHAFMFRETMYIA